MATITIKSTSGDENYEVEIADVFVQKAKDIKELNSFIKTIIDLTEAQSKQKALNILDKESQSFINKFTTVLNGITEAIKVIQSGSKIIVSDSRSDEEVASDIKENYTFCNSEIKI